MYILQLNTMPKGECGVVYTLHKYISVVPECHLGSNTFNTEYSMTSLLPNTVAQPTKWRFLPKNLSQLVIFVIELAFT